MINVKRGDDRMIFVTVGSQKFQFNRLLKAIDEAVERCEISEEIFAQTGHCDYKPKNYKYKGYLDRDEFKNIMDRAHIVITHGGTGAIVGAIKAGKKVIAVPRLAKYGEHVDDHQLQLIKQFTKSNLIAHCENLDDLGKVLEEVKTKEFDSYQSNTQKYIDEISSYIEGL